MGTACTACTLGKASHRTHVAARFGTTTAIRTHSRAACPGVPLPPREIQRLPSASRGRPVCPVSNAAGHAGRLRQASRLLRHQSDLASPLASHLGLRNAPLRHQPASSHAADRSQRHPHDASLSQGHPARFAARVLSRSPQHHPVLFHPLAFRFYCHRRPPRNPTGTRVYTPPSGHVPPPFLRRQNPPPSTAARSTTPRRYSTTPEHRGGRKTRKDWPVNR
jgi:hypothetical protein